MQAYHENHGCFPPAYVADEQGLPKHSWRVLILPYLSGGEAAFERYNLEEPWDGPLNIHVLEAQPFEYRCLADKSAEPATTSYVAIVRRNTLLRRATSTNQDQIPNPADTILLAEVKNSGIFWTEPKDLHFDEMTFGINDGSATGISSNH